MLSCSFPCRGLYRQLTHGEGCELDLGVSEGMDSCKPVADGCASSKAADCAPRNAPSMLAKLFANDVRGTLPSWNLVTGSAC